jgi:hypothetical protein
MQGWELFPCWSKSIESAMSKLMDALLHPEIQQIQK